MTEDRRLDRREVEVAQSRLRRLVQPGPGTSATFSSRPAVPTAARCTRGGRCRPPHAEDLGDHSPVLALGSVEPSCPRHPRSAGLGGEPLRGAGSGSLPGRVPHVAGLGHSRLQLSRMALLREGFGPGASRRTSGIGGPETRSGPTPFGNGGRKAPAIRRVIAAVALFPGPDGVVILGETASRDGNGTARIPGRRARSRYSGGCTMNEQVGTSQIDLNRGLRDRLGRTRAAGTSLRQDAELTLAVNDLQDLARSRFATHSGELGR
jgi:hypothetical protein